MPYYDYQCDQCGTDDTAFYDIQTPVEESRTRPCPICNGLQRKILRSMPSVVRGMSAHYNVGLGEYVSNSSQFKSGLRRKSDEMAQRMNMTVDYQPVDLRDKEALGVTDEGLESTRKHEVDSGKRTVNKHF